MALVYIWLTALIVGHVLAAALLLYGVQHGVRSLRGTLLRRHTSARGPNKPTVSGSGEGLDPGLITSKAGQESANPTAWRAGVLQVGSTCAVVS